MKIVFGPDCDDDAFAIRVAAANRRLQELKEKREAAELNARRLLKVSDSSHSILFCLAEDVNEELLFKDLRSYGGVVEVGHVHNVKVDHELYKECFIKLDSKENLTKLMNDIYPDDRIETASIPMPRDLFEADNA